MEVEQLCRIDESQADYLLPRLRDEHKIMLGQKGKYAYYVPFKAEAHSEPNSESNSENS